MNTVVTEVPQHVSKLRVGSILLGKNPRTYFDPDEMAEFEYGLRAAGGVITPILVRPVEGGHEMVAGYRRRLGSINVFGEDYEIPVLIKELTDEEVEAMAVIENVHRASMSPAEEAREAAKILGRCKGDKAETAKRLGWKPDTLEKRLALMNCSDSVLQALTERKIQLGHAELLAAAPKDRQDKVLEKLLAAPALPQIAQFKAQLESISKSLAAAIFDKAECAGCPHDSSIQGSMFSEAISAGHCTNAACYDKKTLEVLEAKRTELLAEFPCVKIVQPGENFTLIRLIAEGNTGVGEEQALACRACQSYGAAVSNVPGKIGNVYREQCFDGACNSKKVAARIKAEKTVAKPDSKLPAKTTGTAKAPPGKSGAGKSSGAAATKVQVSNRVIEYRTALWRSALKRELFADQRENLSLLIAVMMVKGGSNVSSTKLLKAFETLTGGKPSNSTSVGEAAGLVSRADDNVRGQMLSGIVISITDGIEQSVLPEMLTFLQVDMSKHWKLCADFLNLLTKSEMKVIAEELGLNVALGEKYAKVMSGKNDEIIKALLAVEGFDYVGKFPAVLQYATAA